MATTSSTDRRPVSGRQLGFRVALVLVEGIAVLLHPPLLVLHALASAGAHLVLLSWQRYRRDDQ
jgi:hypothetical protein